MTYIRLYCNNLNWELLEYRNFITVLLIKEKSAQLATRMWGGRDWKLKQKPQLAKLYHESQNRKSVQNHDNQDTLKFRLFTALHCVLNKATDKLTQQLLSFSCPVVSDSLQPHGLQHARPPCPSPSPKVCPSSCPLHQRCHPAISSSDALFSFCPQCFPAIRDFSWCSLFASETRILELPL